MRCNHLWLGLTLAAACAITGGGCTQSPSKPPNASVHAPQDTAGTVVHKHDHNAPGKHGGQQQLLGNHEYHAELVDNDVTGEVAIYITDGEFTPVTVLEKEMFLTATIAGQPKEFTLVNDAHPAAGQPRFVLVDKELCEAVCKGKGGVRLNATIKGKPYAATYTTSGHADHEHDEKSADKHDEHPGEKHTDEHDNH